MDDSVKKPNLPGKDSMGRFASGNQLVVGVTKYSDYRTWRDGIITTIREHGTKERTQAMLL